MTTQWRDVKSSNIRALRYDEENKLGVVEFKSGRRFAYRMPESLFDQMAEADSIGGFFSRNVKGHCEVAWDGYRCDIPPCANDAIQSGISAGGTTIKICDGCSAHPRVAGIKFRPMQTEAGDGR